LLDKLASLAGHESRRITFLLASRTSAKGRRNAAALTSVLLNIKDERRLIENGGVLAKQIAIPNEVVSYLYKQSRCKAASREQWLLEVRTACAIDLILRTEFSRRKPGNFSEFIDGADQLRYLPKGTLLLTFHGGFVQLARHLFAALFASGTQIGRTVFDDARGGLFGALRSLQDGHHVLIAPDGPGGKMSGQIGVFDFTIDVAGGAAFLAHASGAPTAWYTMLRKGDRFAVQVELGPQRRDNESYAAFEQRLLEFYGSKVEAMFSGDPQSLSLSRRWQSAFQKGVSRPSESRRAT
jgi:hypothetical protein